MRQRSRWAAGSALAAVAVIAGSQAASHVALPGRSRHVESPRGESGPSTRLRWSAGARARALERAAVWRPTSATGGGPSGRRAARAPASPLECRFKPGELGGTTPKFECISGAGETLKVKHNGAEPHAEVAATRLMQAIGFAADDVSFVERVRCYGCPRFPFLTMKTLGLIDGERLYSRAVDYGEYRETRWAAVERKHPGREIESAAGRGWAWFELEQVQSPRAHVDALRLMAMFLAHWDNKAENQRLVCLDEDASAFRREGCTQALALVQDLGATFGPRKVNLRRWRSLPVWADRASCLVSMSDMPHGGGTFQPVRISEAGRRFLAERLRALTRMEIRAVFEEARFPQHDGENVEGWVNAFEDKVREISERPPCPEP